MSQQLAFLSTLPTIADRLAPLPTIADRLAPLPTIADRLAPLPTIVDRVSRLSEQLSTNRSTPMPASQLPVNAETRVTAPA
ncbi:hypothetical protein OIO90_004991, partial [Microbotryomycetes sp. JL221]